MEDLEQDVTVDSSATNEGVTAEPAQQQVATEEVAPQPEGQRVQVDERGVPITNVEAEWKRKFNDLVEKLPNIVEENVRKATTKTEEPKYSVSQLESYAIEHPEYRPWVEEQKEKLRKDELLKAIDEKFSTDKKKTEVEVKRNQAYAYVANQFPELFTKDSIGNQMWDVKNPIVSSVGQYMNDPRIANEPDGLVVATKLAYADYYRSQASKLTGKVEATQNALRKEQRKTMVEGGGTGQVVQKSDYTKAMERLRDKGDKTSASAAIKEILKAKGMIKE